MRMIGQEGAPGLAWWAPRPSPPVAPNRAVADHDAQLEQLAPDPFRAPEWVLSGHGRDQLCHLWAEMRASAPRAGLPTPEETPAPPMPAHDCLRRDERQMLAPAGTPTASQDPQQLVPGV